MDNNQVILILTSSINSSLLAKYNEIKQAVNNSYDLKILYHQKGFTPTEFTGDLEIEYFTNDILHHAGYTPIEEKLVPGSNHFPLLQFFNTSTTKYDYYWCIEDDVAFNGLWKDFFDFFKDYSAGFITSHIRKYSNYPNWSWWWSLDTPGRSFPRRSLLMSFNPIYRISAPALELIDESLKKGWKGHHEVLLPTLLNDAGYDLADLGSIVNNICPNLNFCTLRTMRWKPVFFVIGNKQNMLYHPVKSHVRFRHLLSYIKRTLYGEKEYLKKQT